MITCIYCRRPVQVRCNCVLSLAYDFLTAEQRSRQRAIALADIFRQGPHLQADRVLKVLPGRRARV